jgi:DNA modification methylase
MSGPPVSSQRRRATYEIMCGNAREVVPELDVVHMVMTSPPYWAKRRYGSSSAEVGREEDVEAYIGSLVAILASVPLHPRGSM